MIKFNQKDTEMAFQTNSFKIAQYILLFLLVSLCIGIVAKSMILDARKAEPIQITHVTTSKN